MCKAVFDRAKDWLDIEEIVRWGTAIEATAALGWVASILGEDSEQYQKLTAVFRI